jgi:hypothetical protein
MLVMYTNAGEIVASATPKRNRHVARPPKLEHAAVTATTAPQQKVTTVRYFDIGSR